jgi:hypothetical protein
VSDGGCAVYSGPPKWADVPAWERKQLYRAYGNKSKAVDAYNQRRKSILSQMAQAFKAANH